MPLLITARIGLSNSWVTLIRGKELNKKKIEWKVINGNVKYYSSLEKIIQELDNYIKKIEKPSFDWATHPKNQPY